MARKLIDHGCDPGTRLVCYRGTTLCLTVTSIGAAARLEIAAHGVGFRPLQERGRRPPVAAIGPDHAEVAANDGNSPPEAVAP